MTVATRLLGPLKLRKPSGRISAEQLDRQAVEHALVEQALGLSGHMLNFRRISTPLRATGGINLVIIDTSPAIA